MNKILIIEPNRNFRSIIKKIILKQKWHVSFIEASTNEEGIRRAKQENPDIFIVDISQRELNKQKIESILKEQFPKCIIVMATPFKEKLFSRWYNTNDINAFISKDRFSEQLIPFIKNYIKQEAT